MRTKLFLMSLFISTNFFGQDIYVNHTATGTNDGSSWTNAYVSLVNALQAVNVNEEIWIAKGTYKAHASDRTVSFILSKNGVKLFGGFVGTETVLSERDMSLIHTTNETILSGDLQGDDDNNITYNNTTRDDNSLRIVYLTSNYNIIDGVTISDGYADAASGEGRFGAGVGMADNVGYFTVQNSIIKNNVAWWGAGINFSPDVSNNSLTINACVFDNNLASIATAFYALPRVYSGVVVNVSNSLFKNNKTEDNGPTRKATGGSAGWVRSFFQSSLAITTIVNNTYVNNTNGGTGSSDFATLGISKSAVAHPTSGGSTISNNVFWGNTNNSGGTALAIGQIADTGLQHMGVINNIDEDNLSNIATTTNTSNSNPLFTDVGNGNFTLQSGSPAIDSGNNTYIPAGITTDIAGNTRIFNTTVDIGAYEYDPALGLSENNTLKVFSIYPNPTKGVLNVSTYEQLKKVEAYNYIGQQVLKSTDTVLDIANLTNGIYLLKVYTNNGKVGMKRFIKE